MWEQVDDILDEVREQLQFRNVKSAEKLREAFEQGDVDGSGELDTLELEECLNHAGVFLDKRKLNALVRALDRSGDKRIQYREFMHAFLVRWSRAAACLVRGISRSPRHSGRSKEGGRRSSRRPGARSRVVRRWRGRESCPPPSPPPPSLGSAWGTRRRNSHGRSSVGTLSR